MSEKTSQEMGYGERIGSGGNDAILAAFFIRILLKLGIPIGRFQALLDRYIVRVGLASNMAEISTSRSALRRELLSPTMTWKVFIKGLRFLQINKVDFDLVLYRDPISNSEAEEMNQKMVTTHSINFLVEEEYRADPEDENQTSFLAKFLEEILEDLNIRMPDKEGQNKKDRDKVFDEYLDRYIQFYKPIVLKNKDEHYTTKCSLKREILKSNISWKVFVKGIIFILTNRMIIKMKLYHNNGFITEHVYPISFK